MLKGNAPKPELAEVLKKTCAEAMAATSKDQIKHRKPMTMAIIEEQIQTIKGAVMIVYPMGLPPYDEVEHILNDTEDLTGRQAALQHIDEDMGELWWAGKCLTRNKKLSGTWACVRTCVRDENPHRKRASERGSGGQMGKWANGDEKPV